ncbi:hypothetical protein BGZ82_002500 [Podila clonocystis]|nr:hypothetical protein BGZ82_002500 [Podila clonocystis]
MSDPSGFPSGTYPQPIGSFSGGATSSIASGASLPLSGTTSSTSTFPTATTYVGGQQFPAVSASGITNLAAAAAAAAAISSPKKAAAGAGTAATKTGKRPYKKSGANSKRGGGGGGRGGGSAGGQSGRGAGGAGASGGGGGGDGDKDSDDDEDEPEVSIEEQFILRLPPGEMCDRFREKVIAREIDESVNLKFKDSRRGIFKFEGLTFPTKLVDLPNIIEAQKTLNGKQMYKIADISQMLIVDGTPERPPPENSNPDGNFSGLPLPPMKPSEYTWPDGLSMALKNVRRRRFRKRVSKAAVEGVENEIERLLHEDALAEEVQYDIREQVEGMDLEGEGMDQFDFSDDGEGEGATPAPDEGGNQNSDLDMMDDEEMLEEEEEDEEDDDDADEMMDEFQRDLEREMEKDSSGEDDEDHHGTPTPKTTSQPQKPGVNVGSSAGSSSTTSAAKSGSAGSSLPSLSATQIDIRNVSGSGTASSMAASGAGSSSRVPEKQKKSEEDDDEDDEEEDDEEDDDEEDEEDDDDDDSGSDEDDDDDEDDKEKAQLEKMLKDEIKELNGKIRENQDKLNSAPNEILKKRFGSILDTLRKELELKTMQLEEIKEHAKDKKKQ